MVPLLIVMAAAAMNNMIVRTGNVAVELFNIIFAAIALFVVLALIAGLMLRRGPLSAVLRR